MPLTECIGWIGTSFIVIAYLMLSFDKIEEEDTSYLLLNLFGAMGVGVSVFVQQAWPAFALQVVWGIVALISIIKSLKRKSKD